MPPNQDKTSNGKHIEQIIAHNYLCSTRAYNLRIAHDATVGERSNKSKKILRVTKINLGDASNNREGEHLNTLEDR